VSALTLAGAADEILGKQLRAIDVAPSFDRWKSLIVSVAESAGETDPNIDQLAGRLLNDTRNMFKHYAGNEVIEVDLLEHCTDMLGRAISNHHQLTGRVLDEALSFWTAARPA
jgi:hypothetical protein